jgi:hypothetical protein
MSTYGRQVLATTGRPVQVLANLDRVDWVVGGITIDWSLVTAVSGSDATYDDGLVVAVGKKGIPFGTVLCAKQVAEVQTVTVTGSPTGGTFTLKATGGATETAAIAYNAAAATVQAAIRALGGDYSDVLVTGSAGGPYTVTFPAGSGDVVVLVLGTGALTGGTAPSVSVATTTAGSAANTYGPFDSAATDGRQNLTRGRCFILNESLLEVDLAGAPTDHPAVFDGGLVWKGRLRLGGLNPATLGSGNEPAWAAFETAFPRIRYAEV